MWDFPCRTVFFFSLFYGMISDGHYMAPALGSTSKNGAWQMEKKQKWDGFIQFSSAKEKYQNWWCLTFFVSYSRS